MAEKVMLLLGYKVYYGRELNYSYSLFQKKRTFNFEFVCGHPGLGGPKIHMVDLHNRPCEFLAPLPQWGDKKNLELNVRFFWNNRQTDRKTDTTKCIRIWDTS